MGIQKSSKDITEGVFPRNKDHTNILWFTLINFKMSTFSQVELARKNMMRKLRIHVYFPLEYQCRTETKVSLS